jgi:hypothetical protein
VLSSRPVDRAYEGVARTDGAAFGSDRAGRMTYRPSRADIELLENSSRMTLRPLRALLLGREARAEQGLLGIAMPVKDGATWFAHRSRCQLGCR